MGFKKFNRPVMAPGFVGEDGLPYDPGTGLFVPLTQKGAANGVATLNSVGKVTSNELSFGGIGDPAGPLASDGKLPNSQLHLGEPGGPASLDGNGKISAAELPPLAHDVGECASQVDMLALSISAPAICIRSDFTPPHVFYLTADPASDINNWVDTGEFGGGAADPTASIGLTATNGVLTSYMRSDAAPAIDQTIVPTWTGKHTFAGAGGSALPSLSVASTVPCLELSYTSGAADSKKWNWLAGANHIGFRAINDAGNVANEAWGIGRTAAAVTSQVWSISGTAVATLSAAGYVLTLAETVVTGADGNKLWLSKYATGSGHNNAPTTLGAPSTYLMIGGREYGVNSYRGIGFGYVDAVTTHAPVWAGSMETDEGGDTAGHFIIATRSVLTNTAPTERIRIKDVGDILVAGGGLSGFRDTRPTRTIEQAAPGTLAGSATIPAAALLAGIVVGTPTANVTYTLPTASDLDTALLALYPALGVNEAIDFSIINTALAFVVNLAASAGWTIVGRLVIDGNASAMFRARRTAANTYTLYRLS